MGSSERRDTDPKIPRRRFLQGTTATVAATALGPIVLFAGDPARAEGPEFTRGYYNDRMGQWFGFDDGAWRSLELVEVVPHDVSSRLDQFTVTFRGSSHTEIDEGLYAVAPPDGPGFQLHLQPAGVAPDGTYYEASFSSLKPLTPSCAGAA
ncbi:MAG: twin-arginine translocation signal domain-containing protein [bacterium]|nr:twin-arginine translocation signal domain-containing protein [bacterium]